MGREMSKTVDNFSKMLYNVNINKTVGDIIMNDLVCMQPVDNTLRIVEELFPSEPTPTKFDKTVELIKALTVNSIPGVIGQAIETTGKVCSAFITGNQKIRAVKYVADAYEVKCRSEVELARLKNDSLKTQALTLYIEKSFQTRMDEINKEIILRSREIELNHSKAIHQINANHKQAILNMNLIAKEHLHAIDKRYAEMIARNENYCLIYRQYLKGLHDSKVTSGSMIRELSKQSLNMLANLSYNPSISNERIKVTMDAAKELLEFIYKSDEYFVPFEEFISKKRRIEDWNDERL